LSKKTIEGLGDTNGYMLRYSTCLGVGRPRGLFFQQGDEVVLTIGNLGTLRTPIVRDNEP
jgi:2-keto-4-pentenoate hydratase/2-oxohepta-3-ene-1,7-dioic acid hydratase in catechol pathway